MNRRIALLGISFLLLSSSLTWGNDQFYGFAGGSGFSELSTSPNQSYQAETAGILGAFWDVPLTSSISFAPEANLTHFGGLRHEDLLDLKLNYLEVPLLLKWHLNSSPWGVGIFAGFAGGTLLFSSYDVGGTSVSKPSGVNNSVLNFVAGISEDYLAWPDNGVGLHLDFRYVRGLTNVLSTSNVSLKTQALLLRLGLTFGNEDEIDPRSHRRRTRS